MTARDPDALPVLEMRRVVKSFGAVLALRSASLRLESGSVHALVGENGAGKSTIVKIIAGVYRRDGGRFEIDGEAVDFTSPAQSRDAGIAVIHQEPTLFPHLSVIENVYLGREPRGVLGSIDRRGMRDRLLRILGRLGVDMDPDLPADVLSIADRQIVEIAKALTEDARILIMDEPTSALSVREIERLFAIVRSLRDEGRAILFISHRFGEVFDLCDTITVLRDGAFVDTMDIDDTTVDELMSAMVGRDVTELFPKQDAEIGEPVLEVTELESRGTFHDVSLTVRAGEIVGLAGIVGSGRSGLARAIFGVDRYDEGRVLVDGERVPSGSPAAAIRCGIALVPADRLRHGLIPSLPISRSVTLASRRSLARRGLLSSRAERAAARGWVERLRIRAASLSAPAGSLSGGGQQRVVLANALATRPRLLIVDEPTRGIDVASKAEIHRLLSGLAGEGMAILMISSELPEILGMSDRVLVMREGRIAAELPRHAATPEAVIRAATGG
ncbi:sugar ABC transporter ATP-binding protein [Microbacterium oryzae]|uniref:sugar ABC transporter ATP-binding protein n=1 Tax=Microbacterium oryzae TaxID=743009 RepID=UPI0025B0F1AD|nr:sugar ABC transporter ATP-binding protein [Microbacterium oryzae]MDN3310357.1 sugar ABC transporter ATP-binding protein [Microbacterium oryzae]